MASAAQPTAVKLQLALNWKAEPEFGGFYAAKLAGYFEKRGLNVDITEGGRSEEHTSELQSRRDLVCRLLLEKKKKKKKRQQEKKKKKNKYKNKKNNKEQYNE